MSHEYDFEQSRRRRERKPETNLPFESVAEFIARGGRIQRVPRGESGWPTKRLEISVDVQRKQAHELPRGDEQ